MPGKASCILGKGCPSELMETRGRETWVAPEACLLILILLL
jgi:hypothetical protein